jgi:anti-sigma factor ChrR (cupin superfamily)
MKHPIPNNEILEQAALYALGALEGEELQAFEQRVAEGCSVCRAAEGFQGVAEQLAAAAKPVQPRADLRAKLFERIKNESGPSSLKTGAMPQQLETPPTGLTFVGAGSEGWQDVGPGLKLKTLFFDEAQGRMTALARMAAGCNYEAHRHDKPEELYVLEGTCYCGGRLLYPGDYHRAAANTIHYETSTPDGCLILLIFSPNNEMLAPVPT